MGCKGSTEEGGRPTRKNSRIDPSKVTAQPEELFKFIKEGNLSMVIGIVEKYKLYETGNLLSIRGHISKMVIPGDNIYGIKEFPLNNWNVVLYAIDKMKVPIIKYFFEELKLPIKAAICRPRDDQDNFCDSPIEAKDQIFGLFLTLKNSDHKMFKYLWNTCSDLWDDYSILEELTKLSATF
jgi:hypothetical protein